MCTLLSAGAREGWGSRCGCGVLAPPRAYALGACSALMAWALRARAPAASLITASRSALGAEGAARLCIGRGSRWLPSPTRATRSAPRAWALRARLPAAAESLPRATRSAPKAWALRARASTFALTPMHAHVASWWWGCRRRRALRAARDARCKARFALLPRARVGWHAARTSLPPLPPRSSGAPAQWLTARGRRASGVAAAPRSRAAGAPAARGRRALGGARACRAIQTSAWGPMVGAPSSAQASTAFISG